MSTVTSMKTGASTFEEFQKVFPAFQKKVTPNAASIYRHRRYVDTENVVPIPLPYRANIYDWWRHFMADDPIMSSGKDRYHSGSLAIVPVSSTGECAFFCVDADSERAGDVIRNQMIPMLKARGIDFIYESSHSLRGKLWLFKKAKRDQMEAFYRWLINESGCVDWKQQKLALEFFPGTRPNNAIRFYGGLHLKNFGRYKIKHGDTYVLNDPVAFAKETIACQEIPDEIMQEAFLKYGEPAEEKKEISAYTKINYTPIDLPLANTKHSHPEEKVRKVLSNCQSFNWLFNAAVKEDLLNNTTEENHRKGLFLANLFFAFATTPEKEEAAREYAEWFFDRYRDHSHGKHQWIESADQNRKVPFCRTMEQEFEQCAGCPFRKIHDFESPRQLANGNVLETTVLRKQKKATHEETREVDFKEFNKEIDYIVDEQLNCILTGNFLLGSGKSTNIDKYIAELLKKRPGSRIIISAPTSQVAKEHVERLKEYGVEDILTLSSHKNYFRYFNESGIECPSPQKIEYLTQMGISKSNIVKETCDKCPFRDQCEYPDMYAKAEEKRSGVIICQHAHLTIPFIESILDAFTPNLTVIDEDIYPFISKAIEISKEEKDLVRYVARHHERYQDLLDWMDGKEVNERLKLSKSERAYLYKRYQENNIPWKLSEYQVFIKEGIKVDQKKNMAFRFSPLKISGPKVLLDATLDKHLVQIIFKNNKIYTYDNTTVLDTAAISKDIKVTQVIDGSSSKTALKKDEGALYELYLRAIGNTILENHEHERVLVTVYKEFYDRTIEFFNREFPELDNVDIDLMTVGTNKYEHHTAQFLVSGVYFNGRDLHREAWKIKEIENFWHRMNDEPEVVNHYRWDAEPTDKVNADPLPVRINQYNMEDGEIYLKEAPAFSYIMPISLEQCIASKMAHAKTMQAIRLRFNGGLRHLYVCDNRPLHGLPVNEVQLLSDVMRFNESYCA